MIISVIAGLVTAFSVYQGCHAVDTFVSTKKAAKDTANDIANAIGDIFDDDDFIDDDFIAEDPVVDPIITEDNNDGSGEKLPPRNEKGQFTKK